MDNVVTTSANPVTKPIGAGTPTDALGVDPSMSTSNGDTQESDATEPKYRADEWLREQYVEKGLSQREVADLCGCAKSTVAKWLKKHDIEARPSKPKLADEKLRDEEWLRGQYVDKRRTTREIAQECAGSRKAVERALKKHDIETRAQQRRPADDRLQDEEWLRGQYVDKRRTTHEIGQECGCVGRVVGRWLKKHGIETRPSKRRLADDRLQDEEWLRGQYVDKRRTAHEIGQECGCSGRTVGRWLKKHGIETRDSSFRPGSENVSWNGGTAPYGPGWNKRKKRQVRTRDGHKCVDCGMTQAEHKDRHGQKLHVHHLRKARDVDDPEERNAPENLVTLCRDCHHRWEQIADTGLVPDVPTIAAD